MKSESEVIGSINLLIVTHGSSFEPESYEPVRNFARILAARPGFTDVGVGFYKQDPGLRQGLESLDGDQIVIVPFLASAGFFCTCILPKKLGFSELPFDRAVAIDGREVVYTKPVGTDRRMQQIVGRSAHQIMKAEGGDPAQATVIVAGHGTPRHPASGKTVHDCVDALSKVGEFGKVVAAFVDEEPFIDDIFEDCPPGDVVVVPYFVANGPHVEVDIPSGLGIEGDVWANPHSVGEHRIWLAEAIGIHSDVVEIIAERAHEAKSVFENADGT